MSFGDLWNRTLVYFGIAEEDEDYYEDDEIYEPSESLEQSYRERPNVRRLTPRRRSQGYDDWTESEEPAAAPTPPPRASSSSSRGVRHMAAVPNPGAVRVHLVLPRSFNDAQQIADKFKDSIPVVLNLQGIESDLSKRLIDFASGLTYALDGGMQRIADKVFMLTPRNVEISAEERAELIEKGFFNQS
jgi:cell division inhibitor SepF